MPAVLVVTTEGVPGYRITSVIGQVVGSIARLSNAFTEGIRTMDGQLNPHRGQDLAQWRTDAVNAMVEEARKKGANAVIGTRFDNRLISTAWAEICAYGTAVRVDPEDGHPADGAAPAQPPRASSPVVPPPPDTAAGDGSSPGPADGGGGSPREYGTPREVSPGPEPADSPEPAVSAEPAGSPEPAAEARGPDEPAPRGADDPASVAAEPSATGWPEETGPEPDERVGPERLRPEEPDPDWPDTPTDPSLRIPD